MLKSTSYVRAALQPLSRPIKSAGGIVPLLHEHVSFDEIFVPHFYSVRPFWRRREMAAWLPNTNTGALGKRIASLPSAVLSGHEARRVVLKDGASS